MQAVEPRHRFKEAREQAGLSLDEVAIRTGIESLSIFDLEEFEGDLTCCYSPKELQKLCQAVGIRPIALFTGAISEPAVSAEELIRRIRDECGSRGVTLEQFEDIVGWSLIGYMDKPEVLLESISIDGLQWLCRELRIDWRRVIL